MEKYLDQLQQYTERLNKADDGDLSVKDINRLSNKFIGKNTEPRLTGFIERRLEQLNSGALTPKEFVNSVNDQQAVLNIIYVRDADVANASALEKKNFEKIDSLIAEAEKAGDKDRGHFLRAAQSIGMGIRLERAEDGSEKPHYERKFTDFETRQIKENIEKFHNADIQYTNNFGPSDLITLQKGKYSLEVPTTFSRENDGMHNYNLQVGRLANQLEGTPSHRPGPDESRQILNNTIASEGLDPRVKKVAEETLRLIDEKGLHAAKEYTTITFLQSLKTAVLDERSANKFKHKAADISKAEDLENYKPIEGATEQQKLELLAKMIRGKGISLDATQPVNPDIISDGLDKKEVKAIEKLAKKLGVGLEFVRDSGVLGSAEVTINDVKYQHPVALQEGALGKGDKGDKTRR